MDVPTEGAVSFAASRVAAMKAAEEHADQLSASQVSLKQDITRLKGMLDQLQGEKSELAAAIADANK